MVNGSCELWRFIVWVFFSMPLLLLNGWIHCCCCYALSSLSANCGRWLCYRWCIKYPVSYSIVYTTMPPLPPFVKLYLLLPMDCTSCRQWILYTLFVTISFCVAVTTIHVIFVAAAVAANDDIVVGCIYCCCCCRRWIW